MLSDDDFAIWLFGLSLFWKPVIQGLHLDSAGGICGVIWDDAVAYQAKTHEAWIHF